MVLEYCIISERSIATSCEEQETQRQAKFKSFRLRVKRRLLQENKELKALNKVDLQVQIIRISVMEMY